VPLFSTFNTSGFQAVRVNVKLMNKCKEVNVIHNLKCEN